MLGRDVSRPNKIPKFAGVKRILLFLIICSFLTQASVRTFVFIDWKINQIRITELYCVNKDNPMMHCNGKCYLSKQLKKIEADYEESKAPFNPKNMKAVEFLLFVEKLTPAAFEFAGADQSAFMGGIYIEPAKYHFSNSIFHPPISFPVNTLTA
ncbi:hypothetical protein D3C87_40750 [compost metagenome]